MHKLNNWRLNNFTLSKKKNNEKQTRKQLWNCKRSSKHKKYGRLIQISADCAKLHTLEKSKTIKKLSDPKALSALEERIIKLTTEETNDDASKSEFSTELHMELSTQNMDATSLMEQSIEIVHKDDDCVECGITVEETTSYFEDSSYAFESVNCNQKKRKRKKQKQNIELDKLYELELKKLREMEINNDLKRQKLELIKKQTMAIEEQTKAIKAGTLVKEALMAKLQDIIYVKKE